MEIDADLPRNGAARLAPAFGLLAWAAAVILTWAVRPGLVLEVAVACLAAAVVLNAAARAGLTGGELLVAAASFSLPLLNTLPAQAYHTALAKAGGAAPVVLGAVAVTSCAALLVGRPASRRGAPLVVAAAACGIAAAALSTVASDNRADALTDAIAMIVVPVALGAATVRVLRGPESAWVVAASAVLASMVPISAGISAYVSSFGLPTSIGDLLTVERELYRQFLFQEITFGNTQNLAALVLLLLPVAIVAAACRATAPLPRAASAVAVPVLAAALVLSMSQGAMAAEALALSVLAFVLWRSSPRAAVSSAVLAALLAVMIAAISLTDTGEGSGSGGGIAVSESVASSASFRSDALRAGLRIAAENLPLGLGAGEYATADPVHTSPHSLVLRVVAELGALGGIALAALAAWFALSLLRVLRAARDRRPPNEEPAGRLLAAGCSLAALSFLAHGTAFGTTLVTSYANTWAGLLALYAALTMVTREARA